VLFALKNDTNTPFECLTDINGTLLYSHSLHTFTKLPNNLFGHNFTTLLRADYEKTFFIIEMPMENFNSSRFLWLFIIRVSITQEWVKF